MRFAIPLLLLAGTAAAQPAPGRDPASPMMAAWAEMNRQMDASPLTGDADRDYVFLMLAQQRGAVELSRAYLKSGKDPDIKRLAQTTMAAAEKAVRFMRGWQAKHQPR